MDGRPRCTARFWVTRIDRPRDQAYYRARLADALLNEGDVDQAIVEGRHAPALAGRRADDLRALTSNRAATTAHGRGTRPSRRGVLRPLRRGRTHLGRLNH